MDINTLNYIFLFAGVSLTLGIMYLILGLGKTMDKSYFYFGLMGVFTAGYYLTNTLPGESFGGVAFKTGIAMLMLAFLALPWFFSSYTHYQNKYLKVLILITMSASFITLLYTNTEQKIAIWNILAHLAIAGILLYGFIASAKCGVKQHCKNRWLIYLMLVVLSVATLDDILLAYFNSFYFKWFPGNILFLDYMPVFIMIVMGPKIARDLQEKYRLEKAISASIKRWDTLLDNVELIVISLDISGNITYLNPYFLKISGVDPHDTIGKNWFETFLPETDQDNLKAVYQGQLNNPKYAHYENPIQLADGTRLEIAWSNVNLYDEDGNIEGLITIGADITRRKQALEEISRLKEELEKENIQLREEITQKTEGPVVIGKSDPIRFVIHRVMQVAKANSTVLLEGETGVGKEVFANLVHYHSSRKNKPFIKVNCSALSKELIESELFGHVKGSFTGAVKTRAGRFELANKGTLFLDEIGELPLDLQPKLLRALQTGEFEPVGSEETIKVDVRIIAATNKLLFDEVKKGSFREDLYYRLSVYPITIPALRQRPNDIPDLVNHFVRILSKKTGKDGTKISKADLARLKAYSWPGNVRELENIIERALISAQNGILKIDLPDNPALKSGNGTLPVKSLDEHERDLILKTLKSCKWKVSGDGGAAALLKIHPNTLRSRMKKLNIERPG